MTRARVFLDSVGLLAVWNDADQWHTPAVAALRSIVSRRAEVWTTTLVLAECANAAARRTYRGAVVELWNELNLAGTLVHPSMHDLVECMSHYDKTPVGSAGLVDLVSFHTMRRLDIDEALTNDRHFAAAGFRPLF